MHKMGVAMTAALLLSACGGGEKAANDTAANTAVANVADTTNYQAEVLALPPAARDGVFLRAVRDAGSVAEGERLSARIASGELPLRVERPPSRGKDA